MKLSLNDNWEMNRCGDTEKFICNVPCSVYKTLIAEDKIDNPYWRENEYISTQICDDDYEFSNSFVVDKDIILQEKILLVFEGVDTLSEVYLNNTLLGKTNNMHRIWSYDIKDIVVEGENNIILKIFSPNKYIAKKQKERALWGVNSTMAGYTHLRKAHCMFGWDWGPKLPDMGIWRDVKIVGWTSGKILDVHCTQNHHDGKVDLDFNVHVDNLNCTSCEIEVISPNGHCVASSKIDIDVNCEYNKISCAIEKPLLWWANGYGEQPLYQYKITLLNDENEVVDTCSERIGLRTLTISQDGDEWGEEFCFKLNGKKIFAMGANYIPEDQIVTTCTEKRTRELLKQCKAANFNFIRVWGGGYYPDDYFFNCCDELGLIVWQDFMFACSAYLLTEEFEETVRAEIKDNIIRLRNHASLGLWCGNNEIESAWEYWGLPEDPQSRADYLRQFEEIIPSIVKEHSPEIFYWPSSPSSGGGIKDSSSNHAGDMHYWDVWHNLKPIEAFREHYYRFCSEYGFESLPNVKTIRAVADEDLGDFDLMSPVMEAHQKCDQGNEKIMFYLAQMVRYPYSFERLIYSSQLVQADCIRSSVEHMRRARGRCMGSAYWQVNDSNPVISWSSIDYYNRWKGLHYAAKRFYNPILISIDDSNIERPVINICNETLSEVSCEYSWSVRNNRAEIICSGSGTALLPELSSIDIETLDLSEHFITREDKREKYLEYILKVDDKVVSYGTTLFVRPKEFVFEKPYISVKASEETNKFILHLKAENFAKSVCLDLEADDCVFSDNWFDIHGSEGFMVTIDKSSLSKKMSLNQLISQLTISSIYEE